MSGWSTPSLLVSASLVLLFSQRLLTPVAGAPSCLCLFDVDRTLTGQQGLLAPECPQNQLLPGVKDTAYDGGNLTLSQVGQSLAHTFCSQCIVGIVTAGDCSGPNSQERKDLVQRLPQNQLPSQQWSGPSAGGEARRACVPADAQSTLVTGCVDGTKQEAAKGILSWLSLQNISILPNDVWHFDDRSINVQPFKKTAMNARQVACAARDQHWGIGLCGATPQEILRQPGVVLCRDLDSLVV
mmetsp:Transcript_26826/g.32645  ORF Transcript_26826/g.32645 Transcript_26826/m.32645 type:complete len:241 (-) Transcript_26826:173-895(-)